MCVCREGFFLLWDLMVERSAEEAVISEINGTRQEAEEGNYKSDQSGSPVRHTLRSFLKMFCVSV